MTDKDRASRFVSEPDELVIDDEPDTEETWEYGEDGQPVVPADDDNEDGDEADT